MQRLTPRLIEAYQLLASGQPSIQRQEGDEYFRLETTLSKSAIENLDYSQLEQLIHLVPPQLQTVFLDISALASHKIDPANAQWKEQLRTYVDDARVLEEQWTGRLSITLLKSAFVAASRLDSNNFKVVPIFLSQTLFTLRDLPLKDQLQQLFPDRDKKTVLVLFDSEIFFEGPFLCITDWDHLNDVSYSAEVFVDSARRVELVQQECSWLGMTRIYPPELADLTQRFGNRPELTLWLSALKGVLSLFAIMNVTDLRPSETHLTLWGARKRQLTLYGVLVLDNVTADRTYQLYSWIYREVPHPSAALKITRNLLAQQLDADSDGGLGALKDCLPDVMGSAKVSYAAFVQEKLKDFFILSKEISGHTTASVDYVYKALVELNESLRKSVFTVLGVVGGALLSTSAVQLNPLTYTMILAGYALFLVFFNVWYLPRNATMDFTEHLRHFRGRIEPYREFLSPEQKQEVFEDMPLQNRRKFEQTRTLVRVINGVLAGGLFCLSGFDIPRVAKSFTFVPTWALGRGIEWLFRTVRQQL